MSRIRIHIRIQDRRIDFYEGGEGCVHVPPKMEQWETVDGATDYRLKKRIIRDSRTMIPLRLSYYLLCLDYLESPAGTNHQE